MRVVDAHERDRAVVAALTARDECLTKVVLRDGRHLDVLNIAWGYDDGDPFAHITTNISPSRDGVSVDFFLTHEVHALLDPDTGTTIWTAPA